MRKRIGWIGIILVISLLISLPCAAQEYLTLDRVVRVSNTEMVLEFSRPVMLNKNQPAGVNVTPFFGLRWQSKSGEAQYLKNEKGENISSEVLQWAGKVQYLDDEHDRLLWTITDDSYHCNTIGEVMGGGLVASVIEERDLVLKFVVQETPFDRSKPIADGKMDNITTEDGEIYLFPNTPSGWERCIMDFETDYSYPIDRDLIRDLDSAGQDWDFSILAQGKGSKTEDPTATEWQEVRVIQMDIVNMGILAIGILVAGGIIITALLLSKRKAGK